jgi:hypothetical protein
MRKRTLEELHAAWEVRAMRRETTRMHDRIERARNNPQAKHIEPGDYLTAEYIRAIRKAYDVVFALRLESPDTVGMIAALDAITDEDMELLRQASRD